MSPKLKESRVTNIYKQYLIVAWRYMSIISEGDFRFFTQLIRRQHEGVTDYFLFYFTTPQFSSV